MGDFFQRMFGKRRERNDFSIEPFFNQIDSQIQKYYEKTGTIPNLKANGNVSLSGAWLAGSASTDFKSVMNKISVGEPQDFNVDLMFRIEDLTVKVIQNQNKILKCP